MIFTLENSDCTKLDGTWAELNKRQLFNTEWHPQNIFFFDNHTKIKISRKFWMTSAFVLKKINKNEKQYT